MKADPPRDGLQNVVNCRWQQLDVLLRAMARSLSDDVSAIRCCGSQLDHLVTNGRELLLSCTGPWRLGTGGMR